MTSANILPVFYYSALGDSCLRACPHADFFIFKGYDKQTDDDGEGDAPVCGHHHACVRLCSLADGEEEKVNGCHAELIPYHSHLALILILRVLFFVAHGSHGSHGFSHAERVFFSHGFHR